LLLSSRVPSSFARATLSVTRESFDRFTAATARSRAISPCIRSPLPARSPRCFSRFFRA